MYIGFPYFCTYSQSTIYHHDDVQMARISAEDKEIRQLAGMDPMDPMAWGDGDEIICQARIEMSGPWLSN